jgi:CheY-like chemotaxis protein
MVLLFEPDPDLAPLWQFLLESLGCTVRLATTLDAALQLAREHAPALAVVRPDAASDGGTLCQRMQTCIGAPVIGLVPPEAMGDAAPDLQLLPLPVSPRALRELVQRLLAVVPS